MIIAANIQNKKYKSKRFFNKLELPHNQLALSIHSFYTLHYGKNKKTEV